MYTRNQRKVGEGGVVGERRERERTLELRIYPHRAFSTVAQEVEGEHEEQWLYINFFSIFSKSHGRRHRQKGEGERKRESERRRRGEKE